MGVRNNTELIESRLMYIKEVKLLDYLEHYMGEISDMFRVYVVHISKTYIPAVKKPCALRNPDAILEMQLQIHMYLRDIIVFCNYALPYAKNLENDTAIENYRIMMCSACKFIEQIVVDKFSMSNLIHQLRRTKLPLNCTYYEKILVPWMLYVHILHSYNIIKSNFN